MTTSTDAPAAEESFASEAAMLVHRAEAAFFDVGEATIDHNHRWLRGERRGSGSTSDTLVGMAEGLRDVMRSWSVPEGNLWPGEYESPSWFFPRRRWDFAVVDAADRPVALIEMKYAGARCGHGRLRRDVEVCAAMCLDHKLASTAGPRVFRALAFVMPECRRTGALRNERLRQHRDCSARQRLEHACAQLVAAGLADAVLALQVKGKEFVPICDALSPERFLRTLSEFLLALPRETWKPHNYFATCRAADGGKEAE